MKTSAHDTTLGLIDLGLVATVTIWGINSVIVKLAYEQMGTIAFIALRTGIAAILFALIVAYSKRLRIESRRDWLFFALAGLTGTAHISPFFSSV